MNLDFTRDFFALFGLKRGYALDSTLLERTYRDLQSTVHPDKFAHLPETERRLSMQWATRVNEAYRTLKDPLARAQYLLEINGVETRQDSNTAMPPAFLMEQMEWREAVAEARAAEDVGALDELLARLRAQTAEVQREVEGAIDRERDYAGAAEAVRRLMFLAKLQQDINHALETLET
jgi:molecular chaperone HscB